MFLKNSRALFIYRTDPDQIVSVLSLDRNNLKILPDVRSVQETLYKSSRETVYLLNKYKNQSTVSKKSHKSDNIRVVTVSTVY